MLANHSVREQARSYRAMSIPCAKPSFCSPVASIPPPCSRWRCSEGYACHALSVDYGQRHRVELEAAVRVARALGAAEHKTVRIDLTAFGGSALTDDNIAVPTRGVQKDGIPVTYVPARNTIMLSLALAWAEVLGGAGPVLRRQRGRLLRLSRLPARVHARLRAHGQSRHQGRGGGPQAHPAHAHHRHEQGADHRAGRASSAWTTASPSPATRPMRRAAPAACAIPAACAAPVSRPPAWPIRRAIATPVHARAGRGQHAVFSFDSAVYCRNRGGIQTRKARISLTQAPPAN